MKRIISAILVCALIFSLSGCGQLSKVIQPAKTAGNGAADAGAQSSQPKNLSEAYVEYMKIKSDLVSRMMDGLTGDKATAGMNLLGVVLIELYLLPLSAMGIDEVYAKSALSYLKVTGVKYTADGNHHTLTYTGEDGVQTVCETTYDSAKDALLAKISTSGAEALTLEYTKTSYGYASQYYMKNSDGTYSIYKGTFYDGKDGVIGLTSNAPAELKSIIGAAEVSKDFPKDCESWYEVKGTAGTVKNADGTTVDFTVPAPTTD